MGRPERWDGKGAGVVAGAGRGEGKHTDVLVLRL